jgi:hypothetical protein
VRVKTRTTNRIASNTPVMHSSAPRHSSCGGVFANSSVPSQSADPCATQPNSRSNGEFITWSVVHCSGAKWSSSTH